MAKPILVGYDPVHEDRSPIEFGLALAHLTGAPLTIAAVYADASVGGGRGRGEVTEDLAADADMALEDLRRTLATDGVEVDLLPIGGHSAPAALHHAVVAFDVGLLVVGVINQDRDDAEAGPGSTAERLMHGTPCPIAVVPPGWRTDGPIKTVGVAYVGTPEGCEAVRGALTLARRTSAHLRLLSAVPSSGERGDLSVFGDAQGLEVEIEVSAQEPASFLIDASSRVDLLICGSRGYGPSEAVLLGGVSREVVRHAHCPVIVLARGTEAQLDALIATDARATA